MPELPEVESVKEGLRPLLGCRLDKITVIDDWMRRRPPADLKRLEGKELAALGRRAKYIIMQFDDDSRLVVHLGMTGRMAFRAASEKHDKVAFSFDNGATLYYNDSRRFGYIDWYDNIEWERLGIEPFDEAFNGSYLFEAARKKSEAVKLFLLDQSYVVGLGNIYACEALYRAGISPFRPANSLSKDECDKLAAAVKLTLSRAVELGGSTLRDYRGVDGRSGDYQHEFAVYDRAGRPCPQHAGETVLIERQKQGGRSTYYCPICQC
jgi:formamidopyrimidine-DNA glycosylase